MSRFIYSQSKYMLIVKEYVLLLFFSSFAKNRCQISKISMPSIYLC